MAMDFEECRVEPSFLLITQNLGYLCGMKTSDGCGSCVSPVAGEKAGRLSGLSARSVDEIQAGMEVLVSDLQTKIVGCCRDLVNGSDSSSAEDDALSSVLADVIVIHFQEVGTRGNFMEIKAALSNTISQKLLPDFGWCSGLLMDADLASFNGLGSIIYVSKRLCPITSMLSIPHRVFVSVEDDPCTYGDSDTKVFLSKKFEAALDSRKGFLLTSIRVGVKTLAFCNCHLYHDGSNAEAIQKSPSFYVSNRREGFLELLNNCSRVISARDSLFVFGDFNSRLDGKHLVEYFRSAHQMELIPSDKGLKCPFHFWDIFHSEVNSIRKSFDVEPQLLVKAAEESMGVSFAEMPPLFRPTFKLLPSEGWAEGTSLAEQMREYDCDRIPAWCDRIFFNPIALKLMSKGFGCYSNKTDGKKAMERNALYNSFSLPYTDHDAVFLLF